MRAFGLNMITGSLYPLVRSSYPIGRFILLRLLYCGRNCQSYCHSNKDLQRYPLRITTVKYFKGESCWSDINWNSDFRQDQSFHMKENNDCICMTKSIYFLYPDAYWVIESARTFVTYMYQIGLLFINMVLILAAHWALPQCPHDQSV